MISKIFEIWGKTARQIEWKFCTGSFFLEKNVYEVEFGSLYRKRKEKSIFSINSFPKLQNDLLTGKNKFLKFNIQFLSDKLDNTYFSLFK
jgi:hypothetical protein